MSSPAPPSRQAPTPTSPSSPIQTQRLSTLSTWLKGLSPAPSSPSDGPRKLTKNKPLPAPPSPPAKERERPGTPLREDTFREVVTLSPSPDRRAAPTAEAAYGNGNGYEHTYTNGYGYEDEKRAWRPDASSNRPVTKGYTSAPLPAQEHPQRAARVLSAPPPARDAYMQPWPSLASTAPSPPSARLPAPPGPTSQTLRYALSPTSDGYARAGHPGTQRVQMPTPMLPIDSFAALSLGSTHTPTPSRSAPPETLPRAAALGQSSSTVSLQNASPHTPVRPAPSQQSPHTPPNPSSRRRTRSSSSPASPSLGTPTGAQPKLTVQCAGITKAGLPCSRQVKALSAFAFLAPDEPVERFCHQHARELLEPSGFYTRPRGQQAAAEWVSFAQWIPPYLSHPTQILLRTTMEAPASVSDSPGHIYAYELRAAGRLEPVALKVGRAGNVKNRLGEWGRQCGKEVVLRGLWPPREGTGTLLRGRLRMGDKARCSHRLERLIHLELSDISLYSTHLTPEFAAPFPQPSTPARNAAAAGRPPASPASPATAGKTKPVRRPLTPCGECGKLHREIFTFERARARGGPAVREWEDVVWPVIERWGRFVELVYEQESEEEKE